MAEHNQLGKRGEKTAAKFLKRQHYKILDKNFQNRSGIRLGEIDLITLDKKFDEIVFVEVKTRVQNNLENVIPEENITNKKLRKMGKAAQIYLRKKNWMDKPYRFDAISIVFPNGQKKPEIRHIIGL